MTWRIEFESAACASVPLPTEPQPALGRAIRQLREGNGQTQEALFLKSGVSTHAISAIETGVRNPTWATVKRIASGLNSTLSQVAQLSERLEDEAREGRR